MLLLPIFHCPEITLTIVVPAPTSACLTPQSFLVPLTPQCFGGGQAMLWGGGETISKTLNHPKVPHPTSMAGKYSIGKVTQHHRNGW